MHFLQSGTQLSSAEPKGKNRRRRTVEYSQEAFLSVEDLTEDRAPALRVLF
uniref:Uncharacterized protein n=1 Tax=Nelumbo nucifera TaxID=4432 RepID=A0A822Y268_NELNU|nr:TPA_asm: hypothetical protein HUJ06_027095 [Nelumbo nucifera]